jgi:hypothetical protein
MTAAAARRTASLLGGYLRIVHTLIGAYIHAPNVHAFEGQLHSHYALREDAPPATD